MMKLVNTLSKIVAFLLAVLFVVTSVTSLLLLSIERNLLSPKPIMRVLRQEKFYARLPALAAEQLGSSMTFNPCAEDPSVCEGEQPAEPGEGGGPPSYFRNLSADEWQRFLAHMLPAEWLRAQAEGAITQFFEGLASDQSSFPIVISYRELKANLVGQGGMLALQDLIEGQPACDEHALAQLGQPGEIELDELLSCRPPEDMLDEIEAQLAGTMASAIGGIPDEVDLGARLFASQDRPGSGRTGSRGSAGGMSAIDTLRRVISAVRFSPIVALLLLGGVTLFGVRSLRGLLRWWGIPLLITGLTCLLVAILVMPVLAWALATYGTPSSPTAFSPALIEAGFDLVRELARSVVTWLTVVSAILGAIGVGMLVGSIFLRPKQQTPITAA